MRIGYGRPHRRLSAADQIKRLVAEGIDERSIYIEGRDGESFEEAVKASRAGDEICVVHAWLLAEPSKDRSKRPHREVIRRVREADAKGVAVVELATRRTFAGNDRDCIYADVVDWFAGKSKGKSSAENGYRGGRPKKVNTPEETKRAREVWRSKDFKTWRDCKPELVKVRYTLTQANAEFGPRE